MTACDSLLSLALNLIMSPLKIATRYAVFAAVATLINLLTQELSLGLYQGSFALVTAMLAGTATGLVTKYLLDKRYIFNHVTGSPRDALKNFSGYTLTGVFTTALFWVCELGFDAVFASDAARIIGAILGLAAGYGIKYQLDKRFVFTPRDMA
jgi:putative flippase GtrA